MKQKTRDAQMSDARRETMDASHVSRLTSPRVSCLASRAPWPKQKLDTVCESISDGDHQAPPQVDSGVPFITISNFDQQNGIDFSNTKFVPEEYYKALDPKRKARPGDVLYSVVGSFGIPVLVKNDHPFAFQRHIAILRPNDSILPEFLFYSMKTPAFFHQADGAAVGAAQRTIGLSSLRGFTLSLPPLSEQRRIVGILSAYDDLIENNRKRIALLEESARRLYKEWFVRLRFPGHERVPVEDGVPKEWSWAPLSEVANVVMGQSPESESYNSEGIGLPFHQGVTGFRFRYPENEMWCSAGTRFAEAGDILFSVRAPVGRINVAKERIVIGRGLSAMREKTNRQSWLLYTLKHHFNKEDLIGGGCIFASTTKKELLSVRLLCPKEELVARFEELVRPIDEQISNLNSQTISLATARDALLPRLMKGDRI